jgi:hypothetical protein
MQPGGTRTQRCALVYIYYNSRVLNRETEAADWEAFITMLAETPAIPELDRLGARISDADAAPAVGSSVPAVGGSSSGAADEEGSDVVLMIE